MFTDRDETRPFKNRTQIRGTEIRPSKKINRYFQLSKNMAFNSPYGKLRHGAVLVKGGSIINASFNKDNFNSFGSRFRNHHCGHATHHAELGCVLGLPRSVTAGSALFVCRINRQGDFRFSKPCSMCHGVLKHVGVKKVYYTTNEGTIRMYKL